ncbi:MAG: glycoside hydrolase family 172 protein [Bacillota bacterium]
MLQNQGLGFGLNSAPIMTDDKTRTITAENPEGKKGAGGKRSSNLGVGRKGRPCITLSQGETTTLVDIKDTGVIQNFWITVTDRTDKGYFVLRDLVLRMYWDGEENPSVEVPLGDFFCNGFGTRCKVNSLPVVVNPTGGMNCYFPMPFRKGAKITIENQHAQDVNGFFYQFNYSLTKEIPDSAAYFHAQWHRENPTVKTEDYTILDNVQGKGQYIGTFLGWAALERYWWGEGEIKFYLDGDKKWPTICGTGTEDYFGGAWCFYEKEEGKMKETTYNTPYLGYPFYSKTDDTRKGVFSDDAVPMHGLYRWHLMDPIRFENDLRVTIQQIGHNSRGLFERTDDISSVAYWYQTEPHNKFSELLPVEERWPR